MNRPHLWQFLYTCLFLLLLAVPAVFSSPVLNLDDIDAELSEIRRLNRDRAAIESIGESYGGRSMDLLKLGANPDNQPAILVIANLEGGAPLATKAALDLGRYLLTRESSSLDSTAWYILPLGNPDGFARLEDPLSSGKAVNDRPVNDDNDDATDEDGPEDLNGDGRISWMRIPDPAGIWMNVEGYPGLLKRADPETGERGQYRLEIEGRDNDGDGQLNEDSPGGVLPGRNFPHRFEHYVRENGLHAASEPESRAILRFAFDHPNIAQVIVLGRTNNLRSVPEPRGTKYQVSGWFAERIGISPGRYTLEELQHHARDAGYQNVAENRLWRRLDLEAAEEPDERDHAYWSSMADWYTSHLDSLGLEVERLPSQDITHGSAEEWAYYQYGVFTFSLDLWTLPIPQDADETSSDDEGGVEDSAESGAGETTNPAEDLTGEAVEAPAADPTSAEIFQELIEAGVCETMAAAWVYDSERFENWSTWEHPDLGQVEIGGFRSPGFTHPPDSTVDALVEGQLPFLMRLARSRARLDLENMTASAVAPGVWEIEAWVVNHGYLPYPSYQGRLTGRPVPAAVNLEGDGITLLHSRARQVIDLLPGSGGAEKVMWRVQAERGTEVKLHLNCPAAGSASRTLRLQ